MAASNLQLHRLNCTPNCCAGIAAQHADTSGWRISSWMLLCIAVLAGLASPAGSLQHLQLHSVLSYYGSTSLAAITDLASLTALSITAVMSGLSADDCAAVGCLGRLRRLEFSTQTGITVYPGDPPNLAGGPALCILYCGCSCNSKSNLLCYETTEAFTWPCTDAAHATMLQPLAALTALDVDGRTAGALAQSLSRLTHLSLLRRLALQHTTLKVGLYGSY